MRTKLLMTRDANPPTLIRSSSSGVVATKSLLSLRARVEASGGPKASMGTRRMRPPSTYTWPSCWTGAKTKGMEEDARTARATRMLGVVSAEKYTSVPVEKGAREGGEGRSERFERFE